MIEDPRARKTIEMAQRVSDILARHEIQSAVIGAIACAVHKYPRQTRDFDLGTFAEFHGIPFRQAAEALRREGFQVEARDPEPGDPLGGCIDVSGPDFDMVQVVNFYNPWKLGMAPGMDAVRKAGPFPGTGMRVVDLPHLIALKLDSGGPKSLQDVMELLERNQPLDLAPIREVCARFGLGEELERIIRDLKLPE